MSRRLVKPLALALGLGFAFSGCYGIVGSNFSRYVVTPGSGKSSKTTLTLTQQPVFTTSEKTRIGFAKKDIPFFIVEVPEDETGGPAVKVTGGKFDIKGVVGPKGGVKLTRDPALEQAFGDDRCFGRSWSGGIPDTVRVYSTHKRIDDTGKLSKVVRSTLSFRQRAKVGDPAQTLFVGAGGWIDENNDGAADGGFPPEFSCAAVVDLSPHFKFRLNSSGPRSKKAAMRVLRTHSGG